jgi:glycosyltransferase involved in cell wall biosynthesis
MSKFIACIPLHNKKSSIERCINSILAQNVACHILVINDGSTDESLKIVKNLKHPTLKIISQDNKGVSAARNLGLKYALKNHYDHVFLLDADDYWLPDHFESHVALSLDFPDATVFGTNYSMSRSDKIEITKFTGFINQQDQVLDYFFENNFLNCVFHSSSVSFKTSIIKEVGYFNENVTHAEDTDFFIRLGIFSKVAFSHKVTAMIDVNAENRSDVVNLASRRYPDFNVYEKYINQNQGLKKYLDLNRFAIALLYRMNDDLEKAREYEKSADLNNLSFKQRQLLKLNVKQLKRLKKVQDYFFRRGLRLRTGD